MYLNDIRDPDAAPIVLDPKSELAPLCLALHAAGLRQARVVPGPRAPGVRDEPAASARRAAAGRRGRRRSPRTSSPRCWTSTRTRSSQSSRRYLYHAVIGAIALAERQQRRADVRGRLPAAAADQGGVPRRGRRRRAPTTPTSTSDAPSSSLELPDELRIAGSATAQRLDAPRNKVARLLQARRRSGASSTTPPTSRCAQIIEARDILIVDANMGRDRRRQQQARACTSSCACCTARCSARSSLPETDRPRVPLIVDEAHYVAGAENIVDQIATHRRAGLEVALRRCSTSRSSARAPSTRRRSARASLNLLQSRFLFRIGDVDDAEEATRIAMAVYSTMIRDDPDSRARLRVTPEQVLNFPNHFCLASWIAGGTRIRQLHRPDLPLPRLRRRLGRAPPRRASPSASPPTPNTLDVQPSTPHAPAPDRRRTATASTWPTATTDKDAAKRLGARWRRRRPRRGSARAGVDPRPVARWRTNPADARRSAARDRPRHRRTAAAARTTPAHRPPTAERHAAGRAGRPAAPARGARRLRAPAAAAQARHQPRPPHRRPAAPATATRRDREPRRRPTACASSRSWTASTRSAPPSSSTAPPACRASTTRTTRSSRCSTAPGWRPRA